jgi:hypothetical protein
MNETINVESNKIKQISLIWYVLIVELLCLFFVTYYVLVPDQLTPRQDESFVVILYLSYLLSIIAIPSAFKIYDIFKKKAKLLDTETEKADNYFTTKLILFALIEISGILTLLAFYLNEMNEPLYMFGIVFVAALLLRPSKNQFIKDYLHQFDDTEEDEIVYMPDEIDKLEDEEKKDQSENTL